MFILCCRIARILTKVQGEECTNVPEASDKCIDNSANFVLCVVTCYFEMDSAVYLNLPYLTVCDNFVYFSTKTTRWLRVLIQRSSNME